MAYPKTPRARKPTEKAAAYSKKKAVEEKDKESGDDDDDDSSVSAAPDSVPYTRTSAAHKRLKEMFADGAFNNEHTLKHLYLLEPKYRKYKSNTLRGAFGDLKKEFLSNRPAVDMEKLAKDEKDFEDEWMPKTKPKGKHCTAGLMYLTQH